MMQILQAQMAVRDKVLEAAADLVPVPAPEALVESETRRRVEDLAHRLSHQKVSLDQYLAATGQEPEAFLEEVRTGATRGVLADLALRAVIAQEAIEPADDEVDAEIVRLAERVEQKPDECAATWKSRARWRRYALMSPGGKHSSSSWTTRPWSTKKETNSISRCPKPMKYLTATTRPTAPSRGRESENEPENESVNEITENDDERSKA